MIFGLNEKEISEVVIVQTMIRDYPFGRKIYFGTCKRFMNFLGKGIEGTAKN